MSKYFNEDYEEVEAFSQEEVDTKIKEALKDNEAVKKLEEEKKELEKQLEAKTKEYDHLSKGYEDKKKAHESALEKMNEEKERVKTVEEERKATYDKRVESFIKNEAGNDKEYAERLRERFDQYGGEVTLDDETFSSRSRELRAMALASLDREVTSFNPASLMSSGTPPQGTTDEQTKDAEMDKVTEDIVNLY